MLRRYYVSGITSLLLFALSFSIVSATTQAEIEAEIASLDATISAAQQQRQALVAQLNALLSGGTSTPPAMVCTTLLKNIPGATVPASDITRLQNFLRSQGLLLTTATGLYDTATQNAVKLFQVQQGIVSSGTPETTGYGAVGPTTRNRISAISCVTNLSNTLTLTAPNGGAIYRQSSPVTITWTGAGAGFVHIDLMKGATVNRRIATNVNAEANTYNWVIPANVRPGSDYSIRILKAGVSGVSDVSDAPFTIRGALTVVAPNGGETIVPGRPYTITWSLQGSLDNNGAVGADGTPIGPRMRVSLVKGTVVTPLVTRAPGNNQYTWNVPANLAVGSDYKIRVEDVLDPLNKDESDANFAVGYGDTGPAFTSVTTTLPAGDTTYNVGNTVTINWSVLNAGNLNVYLQKNGVNVGAALKTNLASGPTTSTTWVINAAPGTGYTIRVALASNPSVGLNSAPFDIVAQGVDLTSPVGGTEVTIVPGTTQQITWTTDGTVPYVHLALVQGSVVTVIKNSVAAASGSYQWVVPANLSGVAKVRVTASNNAAAFDESQEFSIAVGETGPSIATVTVAPSSGTTIYQNSVITISWTGANLTNRTFKIDLYKGTTLTKSVTASVPATQNSFSWALPLSPLLPTGSDYTVRVYDAALTTAVTRDSAAFTISPPGITVLTPNVATDTYLPNGTIAVTWDYVGSLANVKISLLKNGSVVGTTVQRPATSKSYSFAIPANQSGNDYKIRVENAADATNKDESDAAFSINYANTSVGVTSVTTSLPGADTTYNVGNTVTINWTAQNTGNLNVYLQKNGVTVGTALKSNLAPGPITSTTWVIPTNTPPGTGYSIRVAMAANTSVGMNSAPFEILHPTITVSLPTAGSTFATSTAAVKTNMPIAWATDGTLTGTYITLSYVKGSGEPVTIIGNRAKTGGAYTWPIPANLQGTDFKIRATGTGSNAQVVTGLSGMFSIMPPGSGTTVSQNDAFAQLAAVITALQAILQSLLQQ